jgi:hypothetical protein
VQVKTPMIYGDTFWYQGRVKAKSKTGDGHLVTLDITGVNQAGITATTGEANILLPARAGGR